LIIKKTVLIYILFVLIYNDANALSCKPMKARIVAQCENSICDEIIFISEIRSIGSCARRPIVIAPPKWAKSVIKYEIKANDFPNDEALYELIITKSLFSQMKHFTNAQEYIKLVEEKEIRYSSFHKFRKLNETSIESIHQQWKSKERNQYISDILWELADWISFIVCFVLLVFSIIWFNQWVKNTKTIKWFLLSFSIQLLIMSLVVLTVMGWLKYKIIFFGLLIPGIWFYQIVIFFQED